MDTVVCLLQIWPGPHFYHTASLHKCDDKEWVQVGHFWIYHWNSYLLQITWKVLVRIRYFRRLFDWLSSEDSLSSSEDFSVSCLRTPLSLPLAIKYSLPILSFSSLISTLIGEVLDNLRFFVIVFNFKNEKIRTNRITKLFLFGNAFVYFDFEYLYMTIMTFYNHTHRTKFDIWNEHDIWQDEIRNHKLKEKGSFSFFFFINYPYHSPLLFVC